MDSFRSPDELVEPTKGQNYKNRSIIEFRCNNRLKRVLHPFIFNNLAVKLLNL
jgi:hypothetical protein